MPYREGEAGSEPQVFRGSAWATLKFVFFTTFCVAVTVGLIMTVEYEMELERLGMIVVFAVASAIMGWLVYSNATARIVVDEEGISTNRFSMRWDEVLNIERIQVNDNLSYTLHGAGGRRIVLSDELSDFKKLCEILRAQLGKLPGDTPR